MDRKRLEVEINELAEANGGKVTPDMVIKAARKKSTALYEYFDSRDAWNQSKAQAHYCVIVARELIRSVRIEVTTTEYSISAPAFVRDPSAAPKQGYTSTKNLRNDADLAREVLVEEFARAGAALARAKAVAAAIGMANEVEELRVNLGALSERVNTGRQEHRT
jgi:hypothetical protein